MSEQLDPSQIMQLGMGFWGSKTLLSAVELELFTRLGPDAMTGAQISEELGLHPRAVPDFPDALVALGMLDRDGDGAGARYRNTPATRAFLDKASPTYIGGILEMANARLYGFWGDLTEALGTGKPVPSATVGLHERADAFASGKRDTEVEPRRHARKRPDGVATCKRWRRSQVP